MSEAPLNREEQIAFIKNGPARRAAAIERWSHNWSHKAIQDQAARIKELEDALSWYEQIVREFATATDQRADQAELALDSDRGKTARKHSSKQHKGGKT